MARFFIDRPVFAWVIALILMLAGALAIRTLPIAQFPPIAPPGISLAVVYPGASADTVQSTVVQVIEQQLNGLDHLRYFTSESDKDGSLVITLYFDQGTNPDIAQVQVQNKLQLAMPNLPPEVQQEGIRVAKSTKDFLLVIGLVSTDGSMTGDDVTDYLASNVEDAIARTPGVGDFQLFGAQYAMRIWLDAEKLNNYSLTTTDVSNAIQSQNVQVTAGELGGIPSAHGQRLNATVIGPSRLRNAEEFGAVLLRVNPDGSQVRLRDVATMELGAEQYGISASINGKPSGAMAVKLAAGANALDTADAIHRTMDKLAPFFPHGLEVFYPYDTTPFIRISIREVVKTLLEAIGLVFLVMYLFLGNIRATLIPTIAVPVVLLGSFAVLSLAGFSINTLTMFGMVLAIGLLVDDAIVVVENVERLMAEEGLSPKEAARKSMDQITGALVSIALVISAVFLPMAFFGGSTGVIYRQFSITIISAMLLSVLVAIIFTPALCATFLSHRSNMEEKRRGFFGLFNRIFRAANNQYRSGVSHVLGRTWRYLAVYGLIVGGLVVLFKRIPPGFLPDEDQGILYVNVSLPPGSTLEQTRTILNQVRDHFLNDEKDTVQSALTVSGFNFSGHGQSQGLAFVRLKPWDDRPGEQNSVKAVAARATAKFSQIRQALIFAFYPPAVKELGNASGFDFELLDQAGVGHDQLMAARNQFLAAARNDPALVAVRPNGLNDEPQYQIQADRELASALGLDLAAVDNILAAGWGGLYVNNFIDRGRVKKVFIQGRLEDRMLPDDFNKWYVRNAAGQMVPPSAYASGHWTTGSPKLERYNGLPSMEILGGPAPGQSTGIAMSHMEQLARKLPPGVGFDWTGLSYEERLSGGQGPFLYAVSLIVVFLALAALYESWSIPLAVMLVVPLGVIGAALAAFSRGLTNDVFFQVGLLTTVGLSAKNAILIVEFAKANFDHGMPLIESTVQAAHQRLRPILMTSLAFIFGVLPLAVSHGAGSGGQNDIGTGVIGGMVSATVLAIFFVPLFFVVMLRLFRVKPRMLRDQSQPAAKPEVTLL